MNTTVGSDKEMTNLQERGAQAIEDNARPAEQVLAEQMEQLERNGLFVP